MSTETWRPVVGYEGAYEVSDLGRTRSVPRYVRVGASGKALKSGKVLRPGIASHGYPTVVLSRKTKCVHTLVLEAFVGPRPEGFDGCHNNGIRTDCRLENLRWGSRQENLLERRVHGTAPIKLQRDGHERVLEMAAQGATQRQIASTVGVSQRTVFRVLHGQRVAV